MNNKDKSTIEDMPNSNKLLLGIEKDGIIDSAVVKIAEILIKEKYLKN